jgi:hypothetical protein
MNKRFLWTALLSISLICPSLASNDSDRLDENNRPDKRSRTVPAETTQDLYVLNGAYIAPDLLQYLNLKIAANQPVNFGCYSCKKEKCFSSELDRFFLGYPNRLARLTKLMVMPEQLTAAESVSTLIRISHLLGYQDNMPVASSVGIATSESVILLQTLPDEVLHLICSYLPDASLIALYRTSSWGIGAMRLPIRHRIVRTITRYHHPVKYPMADSEHNDIVKLVWGYFQKCNEENRLKKEATQTQVSAQKEDE